MQHLSKPTQTDTHTPLSCYSLSPLHVHFQATSSTWPYLAPDTCRVNNMDPSWVTALSLLAWRPSRDMAGRERRIVKSVNIWDQTQSQKDLRHFRKAEWGSIDTQPAAYPEKWGCAGCEATSPRVQKPDSSAAQPGTNKSPAHHADTHKKDEDTEQHTRSINSTTILLFAYRHRLTLTAAAALVLLLIKQIFQQSRWMHDQTLPYLPDPVCVSVSV